MDVLNQTPSQPRTYVFHLLCCFLLIQQSQVIIDVPHCEAACQCAHGVHTRSQQSTLISFKDDRNLSLRSTTQFLNPKQSFNIAKRKWLYEGSRIRIHIQVFCCQFEGLGVIHLRVSNSTSCIFPSQENEKSEILRSGHRDMSCYRKSISALDLFTPARPGFELCYDYVQLCGTL